LLVSLGRELDKSITAGAIITSTNYVSTLGLESSKDGEKTRIIHRKGKVRHKEGSVGNNLRALGAGLTGLAWFLFGGRGTSDSSSSWSISGLLGSTATLAAGLRLSIIALFLVLLTRDRRLRSARFPRSTRLFRNAGFARLLGLLRYLDLDVTLEERSVVEFGNSSIGLSGSRELNEAVSKGSLTTSNDGGTLDSAD
jgi:hypothetical protein